jgi:hypothetical protein
MKEARRISVGLLSFRRHHPLLFAPMEVVCLTEANMNIVDRVKLGSHVN